jgi:hypothetical protein
VKALIDAGVPQSIAMTISGHKTASMFRRYHVVTQSDKSAALERVQQNQAEQQNVISIGRS